MEEQSNAQARFERVLELLRPDFRSQADRRAAVDGLKTVSPELCRALEETNAHLPPSAAREANLRALCREAAAAVVTGQQVGLLLGPSFTLYKALSAAAAARALQEETGKRCVPVFWLQTEDNDFEEIRSANFLSSTSEQMTITAASASAAERESVERRIFDDTIVKALGELRSAYPASSALIEQVSRAYRPGRSFAEAFSHLLSDLLAEEGLVFLNPRHPALSKLAQPVFMRALKQEKEISRILQQRTVELSKMGIAPQVHIRSRSPLFFFHADDGSRHRLELSGAKYTLVGKNEELQPGALERMLEESPERFSTSALLRPLFQNHILPCAAYIGGDAELKYFAQLAPLYPLFELKQPLSIPRSRVLVVEDKPRKLLSQLQLTYDDLLLPQEELLARVAPAAAKELPQPAELETASRQMIDGGLELLRKHLSGIDPTLVPPLEKTRRKIYGRLEKHKKQYAAALYRTDELTRRRLEEVQKHLRPAGGEQERFYCALSFYLRLGGDFLSSLRSSIVAYRSDLSVIEL